MKIDKSNANCRYFKLLKDTPEIKAGAILFKTEKGGILNNQAGYVYKVIDIFKDLHNNKLCHSPYFHEGTVIDNPEWFEEVDKCYIEQSKSQIVQELMNKVDEGFNIKRFILIPENKVEKFNEFINNL